jgi:hypothetical protein
MVSGLNSGDLSGVLPPYVFATFAACCYAAFLPNHPTRVNVALSHARVSH